MGKTTDDRGHGDMTSRHSATWLQAAMGHDYKTWWRDCKPQEDMTTRQRVTRCQDEWCNVLTQRCNVIGKRSYSNSTLSKIETYQEDGNIVKGQYWTRVCRCTSKNDQTREWDTSSNAWCAWEIQDIRNKNQSIQLHSNNNKVQCKNPASISYTTSFENTTTTNRNAYKMPIHLHNEGRPKTSKQDVKWHNGQTNHVTDIQEREEHRRIDWVINSSQKTQKSKQVGLENNLHKFAKKGTGSRVMIGAPNGDWIGTALQVKEFERKEKRSGGKKWGWKEAYENLNRTVARARIES